MVVPLFFLMIFTIPSDIFDVLGVKSKNIYLFSGFLFFETLKDATKKLVKHYKKEIAFGEIVTTLYHRKVVHPQEAENLALAAQLQAYPKIRMLS